MVLQGNFLAFQNTHENLSTIKGYFYCTLWTRFQVPSTFLRGEKCPTIQGDRDIGNDRGKSAIKGYFYYTIWMRFHIPSTFLRGEKYPTVQGD